MKTNTITRRREDAKIEIPLKQWKADLGDRLHMAPHAVEQHLSHGTLPYPICQRVNTRVIFVTVTVEDYLGTITHAEAQSTQRR